MGASGTNPSRSQLGMLKEAYEEGKRLIDDQIAEADSMRQRSVQFMTFTGSATAFLVGTSLKDGSPQQLDFYLMAILATVVSVLTILAMLAILLSLMVERSASSMPRVTKADWAFRLNPGTLVRKWLSPDVGAPTENDFYRGLALEYEKGAAINDAYLGQMRRWYAFLLVVGSAQVLAWAALAWIFG